jgi:hypothetical protein
MSVSYSGGVAWVYDTPEEGQVLRAVFKTPHDLVLEIQHNGNPYLVSLTARGKRWQGWVQRPNKPNGNVVARVFRSDDDLFLFGEWTEVGKTWHFWADLGRDQP